MLLFVAPPLLPPVLAQVIDLPKKPVKPNASGNAVVKFRVSQSNRTAQRLRFYAFYPDRKGKGPGEPFTQVSFLPPEMLVPPGGRTKTARATFNLIGMSGSQKLYVCAKTIPKVVNTSNLPTDRPVGIASLSVLSCWPLLVYP